MHLSCVATEEACGNSRMRILLLQHQWNSMHRSVREREARCVATSADDTRRRFTSHFARDPAPRSECPANCFPVFPGSGAIERMEIQQLEGEARLRQDVLFDAALRTNEKRLDARVSLLQHARNREAGIEVSTRAPAREKHPHRAGSASRPTGPVAARAGFSRVLPMLTRMPVITSDSTRLERPYEINGRVNPVVGSKPIATPMWR